MVISVKKNYIFMFIKNILVFTSPQISIAFAQGPLVHELTQIIFVNICVICGRLYFNANFRKLLINNLWIINGNLRLKKIYIYVYKKTYFCFYQPTNFYRIRSRTVGLRIDINKL